MSVIEELIRIESEGTLSFGNYLLESKKKVLDFEVKGDIYKVKTFKEITRLEKNGSLLFESVPGTTVHNFDLSEKIISFDIEGIEDAQVTLELEADKEYKLLVEQIQVGKIKSNFAGKIIFSLELNSEAKKVEIKKI